MASRGAFGFRSAKQTEKSTSSKERLPVGLSRKNSMTSTASDTSRLPVQPTSFFSRSKSKAMKDPTASKIATSSGIPVGKVQDSARIGPSKDEHGARGMVDIDRRAGLGISTVNQITAAQPSRSGKITRNVLRRKAPLDQRGKYAHTESSASSHELAPCRPSREIASTPETYSDDFGGSLLGLRMPAASTGTSDRYGPFGLEANSESATSSSRMASFNTRQPSQPSSTPNLPQPLPTFVHDSGSSTRRSESPGNFSRTSTPTSMSSQSPGVGTPVKAPLRRQISPTRSRPPVTRRKFPAEDIIPSQGRGLTAVRESATSSSSSSTIKAGQDKSQSRSDQTSSVPPSPPMRQSSKRLRRPDEYEPRLERLRGVPERDPRNAGPPQNALVAGQSETTQSNRIKSPPPRPSREGTPRLDDAFASSQVIRTHLPPLQTSGHRHRHSQDKDVTSAESRSGVSNPGRDALGRSPSSVSASSVKPSRMLTPNPLIAKSSRTTPEDSFASSRVSPVDTHLGSVRFAKEPSPLSAGSNKSSSRFGLFTRRTRSPLESNPVESAEKAAKKGPAAGTGHEGYGKYSRRGRSGSTSTSASRGRSTSTASAGLTSTSRKSSFTSRDEPMDDFLSARLAPVVIPGGGRPADSPFHGSSRYPSSTGESSVAMTSSDDLFSRATLPPQQPSNVVHLETSGTHHLRRDYRKLPRRQDNSEYAYDQQPPRETIDTRQNWPTLAARRSAHRSQVFGEEVEPLRLPAPLDVRAKTASPGMDSRDTIQSSIRTDVSDISEGHEGNWLKSRRTERRARSPRKWNLFQRTQPSPRRVPDVDPARPDDTPVVGEELPATVSAVPETRPVPFYALLDGSESEGLDQMGSAFPPDNTQASADNSAVSQRREHRLSSLLPSPPTHTAEFLSQPGPSQLPVVLRPQAIEAESETKTRSEPKKPRLQQVGRIPRVVSKRDRPHNPPPQSFSRPFARHAALNPEPPASAPLRRSIEAERPLLGIQNGLAPSTFRGNQDSAKPASAPVQPSETFVGEFKDEFLSFPQRAGSQVSGISGSSSSGVMSLTATTAVIPDPGTALAEDEVWHEYNEFLDTVGSSPAQLPNDSRNAQDETVQKSKWVPAPLSITKEPSVAGSPEKLSSLALPSSAPTGPLPSPPDRRKLLSIDNPSTPGTISDLLAGYGDRNRSSGISQRKSGYTASRYSTSSIESDADSLAHREGTQGPDADAATVAPLFQSNLRFNALMTSRWLSFDRVLFSPAHLELDSNRLLVLDGIGNDDWSFYCAETYKSASIFNLSPTPSRPQQQNAALQLPKNHRQIQLSNLGNRFPFPPGFFSGAVLRFPSATTEAAYLNAFSECIRVLRPGAYLEISVLDLDMVNMGNKARKALRELKVRMQVAQPGVTLKPLSDNIQKIAKRSGFENLQRTLINIPVAGVVNDSRSNSIDAKSGSLENLRKEAYEKGAGGLAKTLPQVGRWWFTRCYELGSMPYEEMERSIWNDKALLEECEKKETGFKLLLCYAQKPELPTGNAGPRSKITKVLRSKV